MAIIRITKLSNLISLEVVYTLGFLYSLIAILEGFNLLSDLSAQFDGKS